jgi:hypothetical protein
VLQLLRQRAECALLLFACGNQRVVFQFDVALQPGAASQQFVDAPQPFGQRGATGAGGGERFCNRGMFCKLGSEALKFRCQFRATGGAFAEGLNLRFGNAQIGADGVFCIGERLRKRRATALQMVILVAQGGEAITLRFGGAQQADALLNLGATCNPGLGALLGFYLPIQPLRLILAFPAASLNLGVEIVTDGTDLFEFLHAGSRLFERQSRRFGARQRIGDALFGSAHLVHQQVIAFRLPAQFTDLSFETANLPSMPRARSFARLSSSS